MLTKSDFPSTIRKDLEVGYSEGLKKVVNTNYTQFLDIVYSSSNAKDETFYGDKPRMRRWRGERQPTSFFEYTMTIKSDEWELTRTYKKADLNRDQSPSKSLLTKVMDFGQEVESTKEQEFWEFLRNGVSIKGFDRANLYDFNHAFVDSKGTTVSTQLQSNLHLGGSQLDSTTLQLERAHYTNLKSDRNQNLGQRLTHVVVFDGSLNHKNAMELNNSTFTVEASAIKGTMTSNVFSGSLNIVTTVYGIGASEWISFSLNNPEFKPVKVLSETSNPGFDNMQFESLGHEDTSDASFWRDEVAVGVKGYWDYNPGYWFTTKLNGSSAYTYTPADFESQRIG